MKEKKVKKEEEKERQNKRKHDKYEWANKNVVYLLSKFHFTSLHFHHFSRHIA